MNEVNLMVSGDVRLNGFADTFQILESVTDGFIALDRDWNFVYLNAEAARTLGRTSEDLTGKNLWMEFPELEATPFGQLYRRAVRENRVLTLEGYYPPFDAWFNVRAYPNENGLTIFFINITEQKLAAEKLRESDEQYRLLFDSIDAGFCVCEILVDNAGKPYDYRFLEVNQTFEEHTGLKDATGRTALELVPNLEKHWIEIYGKVALTGNPVRFVQGSEAMGRWFDVYAFRFGQPESRKFAVLFNDITERRQTEEQLRRNHETFFNLVQNAPFGIYVVDGDFRLTNISLGSQKVFSNIDPLIGRDFAEILRIIWEEPFATEAIEHFRRTLETGEPYWAANTTEQRGNIGEVESYDWKIERVTLPSGSFGVVCYFYDLTEQRLIEQALRESDARLRLAIDISRTSTFDIDLLTDTVQTDAIGREVYGFEADEPLTFSKIQSRFHPEDLPEVMRRVSAAFAPAGSDEFEVEQRIIRTNGETRWIRVRGRAFFEGEGETRRAVRCLGTYIDITESKKSEEKLRFLIELNQTLLSLTEPDEIMAATAQMLGEFLQVNRCAYAEVEADENHFHLTGNYTHDTFSIVGYLAFESFGDEVLRLMRTGEPYVVNDVEQDPRAARFLDAYHQTDIAAVICLPLHKEGRFTAAMAVHQKTPRQWMPEEIELVQLVVHRCWESLERTRSNKRLRESEARFRNMADHAPVMIWITEPDGACTYLSQSWYEFTGQTPETGLGFGWLDATHPDDAAETGRIFAAANERHEPFRLEYRLRRKDGEYRWAIDSAQPHFAENGDFLGYIGSVIDITERKQVEEALRESEQQVRVVTDALPVLISYIDAEQRYRFVNQRYSEWFKLPQEEIVGKHIRDIVGKNAFSVVEPTMKRALSGEEIEFEQMLHYSVGDKFVHVNYIPHRDAETGEVKGFYALIQDISERKKAEEALRQSRTQLDLALQVGRAGTFEWNIKNNVNFWSPEIEELYGIPAGSFEGTLEGWVKRVVPEDVAKVKEGIETSLKMRLDEYIYEFRAVLPDGSHRWLEGRSRFEYDAGGKPVRMFGINVDITDRKRAEEAVRESSEFNQSVLDSLLAHIAVLDKDGNITAVNQAWRRFATENGADWTMRGVGIGTNYLDICHNADGEDANDAKTIYQGIKNVLEGRSDFFSLEYPCHSPTQKRWFMLAVSPLSRTAEGGVVVSHLNITARKLAEEALREADRRKDEFLATLAHELRNPLAPIQTALEIMHSGASKEKGQEAREIIERQVTQLKHLVDDLLDISRITQGKIVLKKTRMDLRDAVNAALEASRPSIDDNKHDLTVSLPDEPVFIDGDLTRLAQVFLNLLNNAAKFTNPGGKIAITAERENGNAIVRVKDNGIGIPPEMLERVFEMFSQVERNGTRPQSGLGIGLNLVKRLVEKHGGDVVAQSAGINAGSEFVVHLPLAAEQTPLLNKEAEDGASAAPVGKRRILVVDDNVDAADMLQFALELDKHQVVTAYDAGSALSLANDFQPEVCLLDIGLPDIDGYELARRLREKMPDVFLIALSGWGQDEDRRRSSEAGFNHHLVKPIKLDDINKLLV